MANKIKNSVSYKGQVTVKYIYKGKQIKKTIHNNGTLVLFEIICKLLAGQDVSNNITAYKIDIQKKQSDDSFKSILKNPLFISSPLAEYSSEIQNWLCRYTATLRSSDFDRYDLSETDTFRLSLQNRNSQELAFILDEDIYYLLLNTGEGVQSIIEWTLQIMNEGEN